MKLNTEKLYQDLTDIAKKHNLRSGSFCAENEEGDFIGLFGIGNKEKSGQIYSLFLVSRLYQSAREKFLKLMEK